MVYCAECKNDVDFAVRITRYKKMKIKLCPHEETDYYGDVEEWLCKHCFGGLAER